MSGRSLAVIIFLLLIIFASCIGIVIHDVRQGNIFRSHLNLIQGDFRRYGESLREDRGHLGDDIKNNIDSMSMLQMRHREELLRQQHQYIKSLATLIQRMHIKMLQELSVQIQETSRFDVIPVEFEKICSAFSSRLCDLNQSVDDISIVLPRARHKADELLGVISSIESRLSKLEDRISLYAARNIR